MIRTIQGDFGPDESTFLSTPQTYGMTGIIAQRSRLNNTVVVEPEPMAEVKTYNVGFEYIPPEPPMTTTAAPTTAPVTTTPIPTTGPPTTTTTPPTTTTSSTPPTSTTTTLTPTSTLPP